MLRHSFARRQGVTMMIGLGAMAIVSCGGEMPPTTDSPLQSVSGQVIVDGRPTSGVLVRLHPLNQVYDPDIPHPFGETGPDGAFQLRLDDRREGAPQGQYLVTLEWSEGSGGGDRLGGVFAEPDGSGLTEVIDETTTELPPFEVSTSVGSGSSG